MSWPLKRMHENPTIGIGITTYNRPAILEQCLEAFRRYMPPNATLVINDDTGRDEGVAASKNRCLAKLSDYDYIFLFDDDMWPIKGRWWIPFINSAIEHGTHVLSSSWAIPSRGQAIEKEEAGIRSMLWTCGGCIFMTSHVLKKNGGYSTAFGKWGGAHEEYAQRAWLHGLSPHRLCEIAGSTNYFQTPKSNGETLFRTPTAVVKHYISKELRSWYPYKPVDIILVAYPNAENPSLIENWIKTVPTTFQVLLLVSRAPEHPVDGACYIDITKEQIMQYLYYCKSYINSITVIDPKCAGGGIYQKTCAVGVLGEDTSNQEWLTRVPGVLPANRVLSPTYIHIPKDNIHKYMNDYFATQAHPMYADIPLCAAVNLTPLPSKKPVYVDMRPVVMILGCRRYRESLLLAMKRFVSPLWYIVGVEGGAEETSYDDVTGILSLPVEDTYDKHPLKTYAAFEWILNKWPNAVGIFKTDEDIWFKDLHELEMHIATKHNLTYWGLRVEKTAEAVLRPDICAKLRDDAPNKTHPASHYCWGHGYYLARGAAALLANHREDYDSQYLEDVCTGYCLNKYSITPMSVRMRYMEVDRDAILRGDIVIQEGHKLDMIAWGGVSGVR